MDTKTLSQTITGKGSANIKKLQPFLVFVIIFTIVSCSENPTKPELDALAGSYEMTRVNDQTIPFVMDTTVLVPPEKADSCQTFYHGGWLTLKKNGKYEMEYDYRATLCENEGKRTAGRVNYGHYDYNLDERTIRLQPNDELSFEEDVFDGDIRNLGMYTDIWITIEDKRYIFESMVAGL